MDVRCAKPLLFGLSFCRRSSVLEGVLGHRQLILDAEFGLRMVLPFSIAIGTLLMLGIVMIHCC